MDRCPKVLQPSLVFLSVARRPLDLRHPAPLPDLRPPQRGEPGALSVSARRRAPRPRRQVDFHSGWL